MQVCTRLCSADALAYLTEPGGGFQSEILAEFSFVNPRRWLIYRAGGSSSQIDGQKGLRTQFQVYHTKMTKFQCTLLPQLANSALGLHQVEQVCWEVGSGMRFRPILVPSVCDGVRLTRVGEKKILKSKFQNLLPVIEFIATYQLSFSAKLTRFSKNISFQANLDEK